ncbi:retrovirus-related pol polyprotein from transposon TNT 1-94 [Tanacetum coccineum]
MTWRVGLKWIFKTKFLTDGGIQKHKARLLVKGYAQQQEIDYEETFSPVAQFDTVRIILALAAQKQWKVFQFDVKSAFLNGDLHGEVYVSQPPGFENFDDPNKVFRLKKALYGLKQAPRAWYTKIDEFFHKNDLERSEHEPTLYLKKQELCYFLGLEIVQTDAGIFMSQKKYVEDTLQKFNMVGCKTIFTPMNINEKLQPEDVTGMVNGSLYRSLIGRLLYLTHSRPDISFSIGVLSRFMHKPSKHHFGAAKRVLRYLAGTKEFGIWFRRTKDMNLKGFTDTAVSWSSKKQATVALSSTKAEYVAATSSACQAVWLRRILCDLSEEQVEATDIFCDNQSAVMLARNPIYHGRTKHVEIKHHFIRELIARGEVNLKSCRTEEKLADLMTKINTRGDTSQSITTQSSSSSSVSLEEDTESEGLQLRRSKRGNVLKQHFEGRGTASKKTSATNVESAIGKEVWKKAMQEEINSIEKIGTCKLVNLPDGKKAIGLRFETVRIILALAAHMRWTVFQFDVKSAFLNGELKEESNRRKMAFFVSQGKYARDILKQFNMEGCNTEETPMNVHERLVIDDSTGMADARKFKNLVRRLIYRICSWSCIKGLCIVQVNITMEQQREFLGVVTWASKKQATIALSSTEAEYISAATAACQAVRLRRVLEDLNQTQEHRSVTFAMTRNPVLHSILPRF